VVEIKLEKMEAIKELELLELKKNKLKREFLAVKKEWQNVPISSEDFREAIKKLQKKQKEIRKIDEQIESMKAAH